MQSYSLIIDGIKVTLRKKGSAPIVLAKINSATVEISIAENIIEVLKGEIPPDIFGRVIASVARYYLP